MIFTFFDPFIETINGPKMDMKEKMTVNQVLFMGLLIF